MLDSSLMVGLISRLDMIMAEINVIRPFINNFSPPRLILFIIIAVTNTVLGIISKEIIGTEKPTINESINTLLIIAVFASLECLAQ